jgi:thiamine monophosphate synthase
MTKIITSPEPLPITRVNGIVPKSVFLAGSIEQGSATDWQKVAIERLVNANKASYVAFGAFYPTKTKKIKYRAKLSLIRLITLCEL